VTLQHSISAYGAKHELCCHRFKAFIGFVYFLHLGQRTVFTQRNTEGKMVIKNKYGKGGINNFHSDYSSMIFPPGTSAAFNAIPVQRLALRGRNGSAFSALVRGRLGFTVRTRPPAVSAAFGTDPDQRFIDPTLHTTAFSTTPDIHDRLL